MTLNRDGDRDRERDRDRDRDGDGDRDRDRERQERERENQSACQVLPSRSQVDAKTRSMLGMCIPRVSPK